jgi:hypothetical protein
MDPDTFNNNCFYKLNNLLPLPESFITSAVQADYKTHVEHKQASMLNASVARDFMRTKFYKTLQKQFSVKADYLRNDPCTFYKFHTDDSHGPKRTCSINVFLGGNPRAVTMFSDLDINSITRQVYAANYESCVPFLFNSQVPHCVANPFAEPRYILSIGFEFVSFERVKKYLDETNFGDEPYA